MKAHETKNERIREAIEEFNRYRSPEATAKLLSLEKDRFRVRFTGIFCRTCGFHDYFDDFVIFLEERDLKSRISGIKEIGKGAEVDFLISKL